MSPLQMVPGLVVRAIKSGSPPTKVSPSLSLARVLPEKSSLKASWGVVRRRAIEQRGWPTAGEGRKEHEQAHLHPSGARWRR